MNTESTKTWQQKVEEFAANRRSFVHCDLETGLFAFRSGSYTNPIDAIANGGHYIIDDPITNEPFSSVSRLWDIVEFTSRIEYVLGISGEVSFFYVCPDKTICFEKQTAEFRAFTPDALSEYGKLY